MTRICLALLVVAVIVAAATPALAMKKGTFDYGGYTITVVPYDPAHPGHGGSIAITGTNGDVVVDISGEYTTTTRPQPVLSVSLAGTIEAPDGVTEVARTWTFLPRETHMVWKVVVAWIDSVIDG
jgi:hypothetical protein